MKPPKQRLPQAVEKWWFDRCVENRDADELKTYLRYRSLTDLVFFGRVVLGYDLLGDSYHYYIAWQLDRWEKLLKYVDGPRETYKSVLGNGTWCTREIIKNPDITIMQVGEDENIAKKGLRTIAGHFETNRRLIALFGDYTSSGEWSHERIVVSKRTKHIDNPTVQISSPEITRTGMHPELIICDDLEGERCFKSDAYNATTRAYFRALFGMLRKPHGRMLVLNTPWRFDGICLGDILNPQEGLSSLFDVTAVPVVNNGRYIMPEVYSERALEELVKKFGPAHVSTQYYLWPMSNSALRFAEGRIRECVITVRPKPMTTYLLLDASGGVKMQNDPCGIVIVGLPPKEGVVVLYAENLRRTISEVCERVMLLARREKVEAIAVEANAGLVAYGPELQRRFALDGLGRIRVCEVNPNMRAKDARIAHLIGQYDAGLLKVMGSAMPFVQQMQQYGIGHDDLLDAAAYYRDIPGVKRPTVPEPETQEDAERKRIEQRELEILEEVSRGRFNQYVEVDGNW